MKHKRGRALLAAAALLLIAMLALSACGSGDAELSGDIVRTDPEGLVTLTIDDGEAFVTFDPDRWASLAEIDAGELLMELFEPTDETFTIETFSGRVKDGIVSPIEGFGINPLTDVDVPVIVLLMEDGSVEWLSPSPYFAFPGERLHSVTRLPYLPDIVALESGTSAEGIGAPTVFAEDEQGLHYDIRLPYRYSELTAGPWICTVSDSEGDYGLQLLLGQNGVAKFRKTRTMPVGFDAEYTGTYILHLDEESSLGRRAGMLTLDLELASGQRLHEIMDAPESISGDFFLDSEAFEGWIGLGAGAGDPLFLMDGEPVDYCDFWMDYEADPLPGTEMMSADFLDNEDLIRYITRHVPEAKRNFEELGMSAMVSDERSFIPHDGLCRDVWFGTDHEEQFVRELLYAVGSAGAIYEFDVVADSWDMLFVP